LFTLKAFIVNEFFAGYVAQPVLIQAWNAAAILGHIAQKLITKRRSFKLRRV